MSRFCNIRSKEEALHHSLIPKSDSISHWREKAYIFAFMFQIGLNNGHYEELIFWSVVASIIKYCLSRVFLIYFQFAIEVSKHSNNILIGPHQIQWSPNSIWSNIFNKCIIYQSRLNRNMNNKRVSCVAKNNDINDPKTRTVTIQMNCKYYYLII